MDPEMSLDEFGACWGENITTLRSLESDFLSQSKNPKTFTNQPDFSKREFTRWASARFRAMYGALINGGFRGPYKWSE